MKTTDLLRVLVLAAAAAACSRRRRRPRLLASPARRFNLTAQPAYINQPDGQIDLLLGLRLHRQRRAGFAPAAITGAFCNTMQVPGPTLIVTEGQTVTVTLTNNLPTAAGNTSILFPGLPVTA